MVCDASLSINDSYDMCSHTLSKPHNIMKFLGCSSGKHLNRGGRRCHDRLEEWAVESTNEKDMW